MEFKSKLRVESVAGKAEWLLLGPLILTTSDGRTFRVDEGNFTDLFSIPGLLRSFLFRARKYAEAAVMHDGGYRGVLEEMIDGTWTPVSLSRKYIDEYLLKGPLEALEAPTSLVRAIYWGVRLGGRGSFKG